MQGISIIGCGNMGSALVSGLDAKKVFQICIFDPCKEKMEKLLGSGRVRPAANFEEAFSAFPLVLFAVKPSVVCPLLSVAAKIKMATNEKKLIISIAGGVTTQKLAQAFPDGEIVRAMPNLAATVGASVTTLFGHSDKALAAAEQIFKSVGIVVKMEHEELMAAATALGGSAPAFIFIAVEALADGAVKMGIPREQAILMAIETLFGSAILLQRSGKHPGELKDMVCSPAGTTIAGIHTLEKRGFRAALISALEKSALRAEELSND